MADKLKTLEDTITVLLSVTPDTPLGKVLNLCLAAKANPDEPKSARGLAIQLLEDPSKIAYWTLDVIGSDEDYTEAELKSLGEMKLVDPESFVAAFKSELDGLDL